MPYWWITVPANPKSPDQMREDARAAAGDALIEQEMYFHRADRSKGHILVRGSEEDMRRICAQLGLNHNQQKKLETPDELP